MKKKPKFVNMRTLGNRIEELRKINRLNMTELAKIVGVSQVQISYYEQGQQKPSAEILQSLSDALATSTQYLLKGANAHPLEILMPEIKALSQADQDKIISYTQEIILDSLVDQKKSAFSRLKAGVTV